VITENNTVLNNLQLRSGVGANQHLSIQVKIRIYVACVLSMLLYDCDTWSTHRYQEKRLNAFHFRCLRLRSILGVSWHDRIPNTTIMERTGAPDIFSLLRIYRLRWSGRMERWSASEGQNGRWKCRNGSAEWKMVGFRRTSCMGNYPLLPDLSVAPNSVTRTY